MTCWVNRVTDMSKNARKAIGGNIRRVIIRERGDIRIKLGHIIAMREAADATLGDGGSGF